MYNNNLNESYLFTEASFPPWILGTTVIDRFTLRSFRIRCTCTVCPRLAPWNRSFPRNSRNGHFRLALLLGNFNLCVKVTCIRWTFSLFGAVEIIGTPWISLRFVFCTFRFSRFWGQLRILRKQMCRTPQKSTIFCVNDQRHDVVLFFWWDLLK